ncbi:septum formation inhibitor Maf [Pseudalgibacter alginicilyticus]|uniref:Septum formation inhibitor Maf n=1 Tax=Pseudalgibacter alginicilyticus TaxID=1736674 RepID=A0A0P0DC76_9FLAO|nr:hypothetical protein [Pseudalgibacter alginicilyticus]ALJ06561.1 septum formation inhibitor Maf [Pseudalgibacter alginicilyticus]
MKTLYTPNKITTTTIFLWLLIGVFLVTFSCKNNTKNKELIQNKETHITIKKDLNSKQLSKPFKDYWYAGKAEISSYKLEQARYGEMRDGQAVLIYVTEDFLPKIQVKADTQNANNTPVLKLNATKKFNTGIYPYSIMQSTFYPVSSNQHALKISSSIQEWCGHVYTQLNNKKEFEITSHSYFEGEADENFIINKAILENELWTQLRIDPKSLPTGNLDIIPSLEFFRMNHITIKPYRALANLANGSYIISYPELNRKLVINFNTQFPYDILGWEETYKSGFGSHAKELTTKATKITSIKSDYWNKKSLKDEKLRERLQLN